MHLAYEKYIEIQKHVPQKQFIEYIMASAKEYKEQI